MEYLRLSYRSILLQPYSENITSSVIESPRIYGLDMGIMRASPGSGARQTASQFVTFVVSELYKWLRTSQNKKYIY